jgi:hypothetical protein
MRSTKNMTSKPGTTFNTKASGSGGPRGNAGKVRSIPAPAKPALASMKGMGGKLRSGDC